MGEGRRKTLHIFYTYKCICNPLKKNVELLVFSRPNSHEAPTRVLSNSYQPIFRLSLALSICIVIPIQTKVTV